MNENDNNNILFNEIFNNMGYNSYEKKIIFTSFDDSVISNYANNIIDNMHTSENNIFYTDISDTIRDIYDHSSKIISFNFSTNILNSRFIFLYVLAGITFSVSSKFSVEFFNTIFFKYSFKYFSLIL